MKNIEEVSLTLLRKGGQHRNPVPGMPDVWDMWGGSKGVQGLMPVLLSEDPAPALEAIHEYAEEIASMANRIHEDGFRSVIDVQKTGDTYAVIEGERRVLALAVLIASLKEEDEEWADKEKWVVPAYVDKNRDTKNRVRLGVSHNVTKLALNPMEEALAFRDMKKNDGMSQADIAAAADVDEGTVSRRLKLLKLSKADQERLMRGKLTAEAAARKLKGGSEAVMSIPTPSALRTRLTKTITMLHGLADEVKEAGLGADEFRKGGKTIKKFKSEVDNTAYQLGVCEAILGEVINAQVESPAPPKKAKKGKKKSKGNKGGGKSSGKRSAKKKSAKAAELVLAG